MAALTIERSVDYVAIRKLLTDSRAYEKMRSDDSPMLCDFPEELPGTLEYVLASDESGPAAVFLLDWQDFERAEIHFCFHPRAWGETIEIAKQFVDWLWEKTPMRSAVGPVPGYNSLALYLAEKVGFQEFARKPEAVRKNGKLYDLILTKIERPAA